MCKLRRNFDPVVAKRRNRSLSVQRLRFIPQNEWTKSTVNQAEKTTVRRTESRDQLCQLQDNDNNTMASKPKRRTRLQCMWSLLQTSQC
ncbi:hypothetical protein B4U79_05337 [Dinothrombium tinctorium]|uniref:Uncharacterized protein n=1 Tax=Dinothrombium tinctorium TaxID=1965070 RepID=A0A443RHS5_9ACAR|nr:hypothetical protein B4U79_05337 [Dinothrombium tinctorium]